VFDVVAIGLFSLHDERQRAELFDGLYRLNRLPLVSLLYQGKRLPLDKLAAVTSTRGVPDLQSG
jgi:hypothetical protein